MNLLKIILFFFVLAQNVCLFSDETFDKLKQITIAKLPTIDGWCFPEKAQGMMDLIYHTKPELCVEIGVFAGSSIYPTAEALKYNFLCQNTKGVVYAIDPWKIDPCLEGGKEGDLNVEWWSDLNLEEFYNKFINLLMKSNLEQFTHVLRMTSKEALSLFQNDSIDILHIDGNHYEESSMRDVRSYLPKVKTGGYIWMDDINWEGPKKGFEYLQNYCEVIKVYETTGAACALLRKK